MGLLLYYLSRWPLSSLRFTGPGMPSESCCQPPNWGLMFWKRKVCDFLGLAIWQVEIKVHCGELILLCMGRICCTNQLPQHRPCLHTILKCVKCGLIGSDHNTSWWSFTFVLSAVQLWPGHPRCILKPSVNRVIQVFGWNELLCVPDIINTLPPF